MIALDPGIARPITREGMDTATGALEVGERALWAVLRVETRSTGFLPDRRPRILFERHWFSRLTGGRFDGAAPDVSSPKPGGYLGGASEYARLARARTLDDQAALKSASWGLGQIMGFNFPKAGFTSIDGMVGSMLASEDAHLFAMARFILADDAMHAALQRRDWTGFAEAYNGKDFRKNRYDDRLREAYRRFDLPLPNLELRAAQQALVFLGYDPGPVDGLPGKRTSAAIGAFQLHRQLRRSGQLDQATADTLMVEAFGQKSA